MEVYNFKKEGYRLFDDGPGIYAIVNLLNNKKYIGSTNSLRRRYRQHYCSLVNNKHDNIILQRAFNKYGDKHFGFIILERCENIKNTLLFIEQKYIDELGDYNICKIAGRPAPCTTGHIITEEHKRIIAQSNRNRVWKESSLKKKSEWMKNSEIVAKQRKKVNMFSINGQYIRTYDSIMAAARSFGNINKRVSIKKCCQGKQNTAFGYKWKYC